MAALDSVRVERFRVSEFAQFLVWIAQIAGRDENAIAIHGSVEIVDFRLLLFLLLHGGLTSCDTEWGAQDRDDAEPDRNDAGDTSHNSYFFCGCLRDLRRK